VGKEKLCVGGCENPPVEPKFYWNLRGKKKGGRGCFTMKGGEKGGQTIGKLPEIDQGLG